VFTRVATGRARVVREIRAAAPLMARLRAPVTARGPWLTAVLTAQEAARPWLGRPAAVVVEAHRQGRPEALALLTVRRRGLAVEVGLLGDGVQPVPTGRPPARLYATDPRAAELLAEGILGLLAALRRPWTLWLSGLPLGCPTTAALAARVPTAAFASGRTALLVDGPAATGPVRRSRDARDLERALAALTARQPDARAAAFLRTAARVHAAIGQLELATVGPPEDPCAALLTLLDGSDRWPWLGFAEDGAPERVMGAPLVSLGASGGPRPPQLPWPGELAGRLRLPWPPGGSR
jgi:hypothetical protein